MDNEFTQTPEETTPVEPSVEQQTETTTPSDANPSSEEQHATDDQPTVAQRNNANAQRRIRSRNAMSRRIAELEAMNAELSTTVDSILTDVLPALMGE